MTQLAKTKVRKIKGTKLRLKIAPPLDLVRQTLDYNSETGIFIWKERRGGKALKGTVAGCLCGTNGYRVISIKNCLYFAHRLVWFWVYGIWPREIDHINGSRDDNRIANLREVNRAQNLWNSKKKSQNKSGFKGVYFNRRMKKWTARLTYRGDIKELGYFNSPEDAHAAYCDGAKKYFGNFARFS